MIRRINLLGGAGSGKSALAGKLYGELKVRGLDIELCREGEIKHKAYAGERVEGWDQLAIFTEHLYEEYRYLKHCNYIITDAPVMLGAAYSKLFNVPYADELHKMACQYEKEYSSLNIWVQRDHAYQQQGRFEKEEVAEARTAILWDFLKADVHEVIKSSYSLDTIVNSYILPNLK